ncbi:MAG: hypothetical protein DRI61_17200 [Chloroflexi bacterium]|nr:MAG: hypothetical protein DRI61_17200 [Chloroflexota bacterium]
MTRLSNIYDISSRGNVRGRAKQGFIRPTICEFFDVKCDFQEISSTPPGTLLRTLDNPNAYDTPYHPASADRFGWSLAMSNSLVIVGTKSEDDAADGGGVGNDSGKAYIFDIVTGELLHTLDNPNAYGATTGDRFGSAVAISESYAAVGAYLEDTDPEVISDMGKAYIFSTTTGALLHTLDAPNASSSSTWRHFGNTLAISEPYLIVGQTYTVNLDESWGKAYIYNVETGALLQTLDNPHIFETGKSDRFATRVAITGSYAIVSAPGEDYPTYVDTGKAYIFSTTTGVLLHTLNNPNAYGSGTDDYFGNSVAISESYSIVGAYGEDADESGGGINSGKAYIFSNSTGELLHTLDNPNPIQYFAADQFGFTVAITETHAIISAINEYDVNGNYSGKAYIFSTTTGALLHTLDNPNAAGTSFGDNFGDFLAINNTHAVVGTPDEADGDGKVYIYSV